MKTKDMFRLVFEWPTLIICDLSQLCIVTYSLHVSCHNIVKETAGKGNNKVLKARSVILALLSLPPLHTQQTGSVAITWFENQGLGL